MGSRRESDPINTLADAICASLLITAEFGALLFGIAYLISDQGWRLWAYGGAAVIALAFFIWFIFWSIRD